MKNIKKYLLYFFCLLTLSCGLNSCVVHEGDDTHGTGATTWQLSTIVGTASTPTATACW